MENSPDNTERLKFKEPHAKVFEHINDWQEDGAEPGWGEVALKLHTWDAVAQDAEG